jgi:uncharacterized membrane-anchored protein
MISLKALLRFCLFTIAMAPLLLGAVTAHAQQLAPAADPKAEVKSASDAAEAQGTKGPASIPLLDRAKLDLPEGYFFIPAAPGLRVMRAYGNRPNEATFAGLVVGTGENDSWIVVINFVKEGYVRGGDAKEWKADELLESLRTSNEEANKDRAAKGFPEIEPVGWVEKPTYDETTNRLVWSLSTKVKGSPDSSAKGVNYNTYALGRDGYFSLNLLTSLAAIGAQKSIAHTLLENLHYNPGKRYQDFNASTDHVAAYGLAALVGIVAAKKLGFLALGALFFAKFAKIILIGLAAFGVGIGKLFGFKKKPAAPLPATPPAPPPLGPDAA